MKRFFLKFEFLLLFILVTPVILAVQEQAAFAQAVERPLVPVQVEEGDEYFRLIFKWRGLTANQQPPGYTADIENGVLVLRFEQDYTVDFDLLLEEALTHIALARQDEDNRTLRLALKRSARLQTTVSEMDIAVDVIVEARQGDPVPYATPRPAIDMAALEITAVKRVIPSAEELRKLEVTARPVPLDAPRLPIRVIRNDTRSRIIFHWPEKVGYGVAREGDTLVVSFNEIARPSLARLRIDPPKFIKSVDAVKRFGGLEVRLELDPAAAFIHFREQSDVILDILPKGALAAAPSVFRESKDKDTPAGETGEPAAEHQVDEHQASVPEPTPDPEVHETPIDEPEAHEPEQAVAGEAEHVSIEPAAENLDTHTPDPSQVPEEPASIQHETGEDNIVETPATQEAEPHESAVEAQPDHQSDHPGAVTHATGPIIVDLQETIEGVEVRFPWGRDVAGAVFRRADYLWVIFDAAGELDLSAFQRGSHYDVVEMTDFSTPELTFIRMALGPMALVDVRHEHHGWVIKLGETSNIASESLTLVTDVEHKDQARVYVDLPSAHNVHLVTDPEVGDEIIVVTTLGPVQGLVSPRKFVDFLALATSHGLAIQPVVEDLDVTIEDGIVSITKMGGLAVTGAEATQEDAMLTSGLALDAPDELAEIAKIDAAFVDPASPGTVRFKDWAGSPQDGYYGTLARLNERLATAPDRARAATRLALARFYFAHDLQAEAIGALDTIEVEKPDFANTAAFVSLKGAVEHRMNRNKEALETLSHASVRKDPGAAIWRGLSARKLGFNKKAREELAIGMAEEHQYPALWRARFRLAEAAAALGVRELEDAMVMWENVDLDILSDTERAIAYLIKAKLLREQGEPALALEYFRKIFPLTDGEFAHRARYNETTMLHEVGEMSANDAIDRLERLRYQWRGDDLELRSLQSLGEIYQSEGRYRDALSVMRIGLTFSPQHPISRDMRDSMGEIFEGLFLDGKSDTMKLTQAIALFYDFRELTPLGTKGDRMIRLLSERLVSIGLLDQAAELLQHQVKYRLKGTARAQVATRLALIQLRNKKPEKAFAAISATRYAGIPSKLRGQRRLIEARALADLGRHDHAIELLETDISHEAKMLRANIHWDADNWSATGRIYEDLLEDAWGTNADLSNALRADIMRMSIAYALDDDKAALERVRRKFGAQMMQSPDAQAFNIATGDMVLQGTEFRDVLRRVNSIDTFEAFMTDFKSRFGDDTAMVN